MIDRRQPASRFARFAKQLRTGGALEVLHDLANSGELPDDVTAALLSAADLPKISKSTILRLLNSRDNWARVESLLLLAEVHVPEGLSKLRELLRDSTEVTAIWTTYRVDRLAALAIKAHEDRDPSLVTGHLSEWLALEGKLLEQARDDCEVGP